MNNEEIILTLDPVSVEEVEPEAAEKAEETAVRGEGPYRTGRHRKIL